MPTGRKEGKREKEKEREKERERRQHDLGLLSAGRPLYSDVRKRRDGGGGRCHGRTEGRAHERNLLRKDAFGGRSLDCRALSLY